MRLFSFISLTQKNLLSTSSIHMSSPLFLSLIQVIINPEYPHGIRIALVVLSNRKTCGYSMVVPWILSLTIHGCTIRTE